MHIKGCLRSAQNFQPINESGPWAKFLRSTLSQILSRGRPLLRVRLRARTFSVSAQGRWSAPSMPSPFPFFRSCSNVRAHTYSRTLVSRVISNSEVSLHGTHHFTQRRRPYEMAFDSKRTKLCHRDKVSLTPGVRTETVRRSALRAKLGLKPLKINDDANDKSESSTPPSPPLRQQLALQ